MVRHVKGADWFRTSFTVSSVLGVDGISLVGVLGAWYVAWKVVNSWEHTEHVVGV